VKTLLTTAIACAALLSVAPAQEKPASPVSVSKLTAPEKALKFEVTVPAPVADVWTAFTTSDGLATWLWKDVVVDLRKGGEWTVRFPGGSTGGGSIVDFTPQRRITMRALCPDQFPTVRRERTTAVFEFEPAGDKTRVTLTQTGWKAGKEWDDAYDYLAAGNAQLLEQLWSRFAHGPVQWDKQGR
jgi:uncharacterized protein YndB with AHSA1/START domain